MAARSVLIRRPPACVWEFLSVPENYHRWVVGTRDSVPLEGDWPATGASLRYTLALGPLRNSGRTVVRDSEPSHRLELEAETRLLGSARIGIEIRPWGEDSLVIVDEHPLRGPGGRLHNRAADAVLQLRNRHMLRLLCALVEAEPSGAQGRRAA
ncbi:SRPBCC family protein [Streptomyces sp. RFCAC02]|uniref:SRPBCC family protein n=1 Tax=Streptomyces sp. RFCAC02 TaxID=2499143 RepID=UPI0010202D25|nr:SRPBCC family protein [Streptomyces sp. RFCAC02]